VLVLLLAWIERNADIRSSVSVKFCVVKFNDVLEKKSSIIVKRHLKNPYEIFHGRLLNISFLHVFRCPIYIHNHKYHLGKFDEKANDGYFLGYSPVSKAYRVFNTRRQKTEETYDITFDESTKAIKFLKLIDITIAESERYPPDEFIHLYEASQRYQVDCNIVQYKEPYEKPEPVVTKVTEPLNHTNDNPIIGNHTDTEDVQITKPSSSSIKDASAQIQVLSIPIETPSPSPSLGSLVPQDRWSRDKHIELVDIVGNPRARMFTKAMAKELSVALVMKVCL
ncbi:retrovirus-related pol polyprotein from transposon TNT 1-94, partial [Tanacetum coccineum]